MGESAWMARIGTEATNVGSAPIGTSVATSRHTGAVHGASPRKNHGRRGGQANRTGREGDARRVREDRARGRRRLSRIHRPSPQPVQDCECTRTPKLALGGDAKQLDAVGTFPPHRLASGGV